MSDKKKERQEKAKQVGTRRIGLDQAIKCVSIEIEGEAEGG